MLKNEGNVYLSEMNDLGRMVIPSEIRKTLCIRQGDTMDMYTDGKGKVVVERYSPVAAIMKMAQRYAESLFEVSNHMALIVDKRSVVAAGGDFKKPIVGKRTTEELERIMDKGKTYVSNAADEKPPVKGMSFSAQVISPIIVEKEILGAVILLSTDEEMTDDEIKLVEIASNFLSKQAIL